MVKSRAASSTAFYRYRWIDEPTRLSTYSAQDDCQTKCTCSNFGLGSLENSGILGKPDFNSAFRPHLQSYQGDPIDKLGRLSTLRHLRSIRNDISIILQLA